MDPLSKPPPPERGAGPGGAGDPTLTHSAVPPLRPGPRPRPGGCARVPAERQKPPPSPAGMGRWDRVSRVSRGVPGGAGLWCTAPRAAPGVSRDSGGPRVPEVARAARRLLRDLGRRLARAWRRAVRCAGSGRARQERSWARMDGALGRLRAETVSARGAGGGVSHPVLGAVLTWVGIGPPEGSAGPGPCGRWPSRPRLAPSAEGTPSPPRGQLAGKGRLGKG